MFRGLFPVICFCKFIFFRELDFWKKNVHCELLFQNVYEKSSTICSVNLRNRCSPLAVFRTKAVPKHFVEFTCNPLRRTPPFGKVVGLSQPVFTTSKLTVETLEQGVKYVQS